MPAEDGLYDNILDLLPEGSRLRAVLFLQVLPELGDRPLVCLHAARIVGRHLPALVECEVGQVDEDVTEIFRIVLGRGEPGERFRVQEQKQVVPDKAVLVKIDLQGVNTGDEDMFR